MLRLAYFIPFRCFKKTKRLARKSLAPD